MRKSTNLKHIGLFLTFLMLFSSTATLFAGAAEEATARSTGNETIDVSINDEYYDRGVGISVTVALTNLDPNSEYTLDWELCTTMYGECNLYASWAASGGNDPAGTEGTIDIGSGNMFTTLLFTFTDPGMFNEDAQTQTISGIQNESYYFEASLSIQEVPLTSGTSDNFILGGTLINVYSYIDDIPNVLKNTDIPFSGKIYFDHNNLALLDYDLDCGLFANGNSIPVDTYSIEDAQPYYPNWYFTGGNETTGLDVLTPTATSGTHHVECTLTRNLDNVVIGTIIGNDFEIIDADSTGMEVFAFAQLSSPHYERATDTITSQISVDVDFSNLFVGETYTLDWKLCTAIDNECNLYASWAASGGNDPAETEGQFTLTPSSSAHSETFVFTDPGMFNEDAQTQTISGIQNESYYFEASLSIQEVPLTSGTSDNFILGGTLINVYSYIDDIPNVLKNTDIPFSGKIYFDHNNLALLDYDLDCGLFANGNSIPVDTYSIEDAQPYYPNWYFTGGNETTGLDVLTPTATSGTHHVECTLTRNLDNVVIGRLIGNDFEIIDDTSNQDDATMTVVVSVHAIEQWGTVTISALDLDAGQEYKFDWIVHDSVPLTPVMMIQNDHVWVAGNDGTEEYVLPFHDIADTTNACITVVLSAGDTELQTVANVCWASASTADADGDGVYDKNDLCDNTPTSSVVQADGCSDGDGDGFDSDYETNCGSDPNDIASIPTDLDNDGTCDVLDTDSDGDGYLNADELLAGTNPLDDTSFPANRLPTCALYYSLEVDGIPVTFQGDAVIPALSGVTAQIGLDSMVPPVITIPAGSYYMTAHCIDLDGDDITLTVNDISIGPIAGEISAGALIVISENVSESINVTITWTDGSDTLMTMVTVNLESDAPVSSIPGFSLLLGMSAVLLAGYASRRKIEF